MIFTRYDPDKDDDEDENEVAVVNPKSDEQRTRLNAACNKVLLFNRYVPCLRWRNYNIYFFSVWRANNSTPYWMLCSNSLPNLVKKLLQRVMTEITSTLLKMVFMTYTR